jgi:hypothetical protein
MDFLNQFPNQTIAKDNASLFSFIEKEQKGDLPFAFGTQSSEAGEISFLNQMKSQDPGESFGLDGSQKSISDLHFLKTIYEVPESSNNIFNSDGEGFPLQNPISVPLGLDFIREANEDSNFNFDEFHNKQNSPNSEEGINVNINNLFKNSPPPLGDNSKTNSKNNTNDKLKGDNILGLNSNAVNINTNAIAPNVNLNNNNLNPNIQSSAKKGENINNNNVINTNDNINMNNNNINKISSFPKVNNNQNINITPESRSNPTINQRQPRPNNTPIIILNKNKYNNDNTNNNNIPDNNNIIPPQFQNISIKPQIMKEQKNNLDDIDKMISMSLQTKQENQQGNKNIINNVNNNNLPNEISDIFANSTITGKRSNIEQNDKDLKNIDNLLNFTKEPMQPINSLMNKQKTLVPNNNPLNNNSNNPKFIKKKNQNSNNIMIKSLPSDSLDKKSQKVQLPKDEMNNLSQMDTMNKKDEIKVKNVVLSKYDIVKRYNELVVRLNRIREIAKEYRNIGNYFSKLISANENYQYVYPNVIRNLLEEYSKVSGVLLKFFRIRNNRMNEMNNEFDEEVRKYSLYFPERI